jgi:hypothetical protein
LSQGQLQANPIATSKPITIRVQTSRKKHFCWAAACPRDDVLHFFIALDNNRLTRTAVSSEAIHKSCRPLTDFQYRLENL